mmetsp:Transcript_14525/g.20168  ORF Transcript_14525/g.20168 Transcript_14525/m.20168 type:complete len:141 (+) Transcript_14525:228-650(+)
MDLRGHSFFSSFYGSGWMHLLERKDKSVVTKKDENPFGHRVSREQSLSPESNFDLHFTGAWMSVISRMSSTTMVKSDVLTSRMASALWNSMMTVMPTMQSMAKMEKNSVDVVCMWNHPAAAAIVDAEAAQDTEVSAISGG